MKEEIICYDMVLKPEYMDFDKLFSLSEQFGYLLYDSSNFPSAKPPYMLNSKEKMAKILVDVSTENGKKLLKQIENGKTD